MGEKLRRFGVTLLLSGGLTGCVKAPEIVSIGMSDVPGSLDAKSASDSGKVLLPLVVTTRENVGDVTLTDATFELCLAEGHSAEARDCGEKLLARGTLAHAIEIKEPRRVFDVDLLVTPEKGQTRAKLLDAVTGGKTWIIAKVGLARGLLHSGATVNQRVVLADKDAKEDATTSAGRKATDLLRVLEVNDLRIGVTGFDTASIEGTVTVANAFKAAVPCKGGRLSIAPTNWSRKDAHPWQFALQDFEVPQPATDSASVEVKLSGKGALGSAGGPDKSILDDMADGHVTAVFEGNCHATGDSFDVVLPVPLLLDGTGTAESPNSGDIVRARLQASPLPPEVLAKLVDVSQVSDRVRDAVIHDDDRKKGDLAISFAVRNPLPGTVHLVVTSLKVEGPVRTKKGVPLNPPRLTFFEGTGAAPAELTPLASGDAHVKGPRRAELRKAVSAVAITGGVADCLMTWQATLKVPILGEIPVNFSGRVDFQP